MATTIATRGVGNSGGPVASGTSTSDVSNREDLANFISMIARDETPFMSSIGKTKATAIYHEWQTDELNRPGNSRITEGQDYLVPTGNGTPDFANPPGPVNANAAPTSGVGVSFTPTGPGGFAKSGEPFPVGTK